MVKRFICALLAPVFVSTFIVGSNAYPVAADAPVFHAFAAEDVSSGYDATCMLADGSVYCWGLNSEMEMGNPDYTRTYEHKPIKASPTSEFRNENVTIVSAGEYNTCALENGSVFCWGSYYLGTLDPTTSPIAVKVSPNDGFTNTNVTALETSDSRSCAIEQGKLYCWGSNYDGELGIGTVFDHQDLPQLLPANGNFTNTAVTAFDIGRRSTCALEGGKLFCAGWNEFGQLGTGDTINRTVLTEVVANPATAFVNEDITLFAAAEFFTCAVRNGTAFCWGHNNMGELGNASAGNSILPVPVHGTDGFTNTDVTAIEGHEFSACAVERATVYCWGLNEFGEFGVGDEEFRDVPTKVLPNGDFKNNSVVALAVGDSNVCVIESRRAFCAGDNSDDYSDLSAHWAVMQTRMVPVFGDLAPRTPTLNPGTAGVTEFDRRIYDQGLPSRVRKLTSLKMLNPHELATRKLVSQTPTKCLASREQVLFLSLGRCRVQVVAKSDGTVLYTRMTRVTKKSISELGVGNVSAPVAKVMFNWETKTPKNITSQDWLQFKNYLSFTTIAFIVGYTHQGTGPKTTEAFSRSRAMVVSKRLKQTNVTNAVFGLGQANPITRNPSQARQSRNDRAPGTRGGK